MEFNRYQYNTHSTAQYPDAGEGTTEAITYTIFGLVGEAGEIANKWKKYFRDGLPFDEVRASLLDEVGDCLWYLSRLSLELGESFNNVATDNLQKLADRKERQVITGSGDNR
jgi:NTP pyrophosphatase (non-canonical NTP hydrolase)